MSIRSFDLADEDMEWVSHTRIAGKVPRAQGKVEYTVIVTRFSGDRPKGKQRWLHYTIMTDEGPDAARKAAWTEYLKTATRPEPPKPPAPKDPKDRIAEIKRHKSSLAEKLAAHKYRVAAENGAFKIGFTPVIDRFDLVGPHGAQLTGDLTRLYDLADAVSDLLDEIEDAGEGLE